MNWPQGFAGSGAKILDDYFVRGTPAVQQIDDEGKLVESSALSDCELATVARRLARQFLQDK